MTLDHATYISLRRLSCEDIAPFIAYRSDPDVAKFQAWEAMDKDETTRFVTHMHTAELLQAGKWTQLALALRSTDVLIGDVGVLMSEDAGEAELGITLASSAQGKSFGFEAVELVCRWLFQQTKINRIVVITHADNKPALALLNRLSFVHTHDTRDVIDGIVTPERWFERRRT